MGSGKSRPPFKSERYRMNFSTSGNGSEEPPSYALRMTPRAVSDMDSAYAHFVGTASLEIADDWKESLLDTIAGLAFMPHRQIVPEAARFRQQVRQIVHRRPGSRVAYRVLFSVLENGPDGPVVTIVALRHGAAKPITRAEAREMEE